MSDNDLEKLTRSDFGSVYEPKEGDDKLEAPELPEGGPTELPEERSWFMKFISGENQAGKIGGWIKGIIAPWIPGGTAAKKLTDWIGNKFKSQKTQVFNMAKKSKDPKTTGVGIAMIVLGALALFGIDTSNIDPTQLALTLSPIIAGIGALFARDNKRKGEAE